MKKNKFLFSAFILALVMLVAGCTVNRPGTQTRIGQRIPNNNIGLRNDNLGLRNDNMGLRRNDSMLDANRPNINNLSGTNRRDFDNATDIHRSTPNNLGSNNMSNRANIIAERVADLNEINRCSVLLSGNTAIVGINTKDNVQGNLTTDLKRKVENVVKNTDNHISNVSVTANPNLFTRISNMSRDVRSGNPISGFAKEFQEILRRINPVNNQIR